MHWLIGRDRVRYSPLMVPTLEGEETIQSNYVCAIERETNTVKSRGGRLFL